jgi:hypothetical protein
MGGLLGGPKQQAAPALAAMPDPLPPAPDRSSDQVATAAERQRRAFAGGRSTRALTMLSSGAGFGTGGGTGAGARLFGSGGV